jgi:hypothetical protein
MDTDWAIRKHVQDIYDILINHGLHSMANENLATIYLNRLRTLDNDVRMFKIGTIQYFYLDKSGRDKLVEQLIFRQKQLVLEVRRINKAIIELESDQI